MSRIGVSLTEKGAMYPTASVSGIYIAPVSYTHLDVYKRQPTYLRCVLRIKYILLLFKSKMCIRDSYSGAFFLVDMNG